MWRGGATYSFKVKNIVTGSANTFTYKSGTILEKADVSTQNALFLYASGDTYSFMENDSGEIYEISKDDIAENIPYLKDNMDCFLMMYEGNVLGVILPQMAQYIIKETVPWIKGDRAQAGKKPATLETWLEIQIPLHKNQWDTVMVNTVTGEAS